MKSIVLALVAAFLVLAPVKAIAQETPEVVATVNGENITRDEVVSAIIALPPEYQNTPMEHIWEPVLTQIINRKLLTAAARADGVAELEAYIEEMALIGEDVLQQLYLQSLVEEAVTDEAVQEAYEMWLADYQATGLGDEVRARHILVATEAEAADISARAKDGEDFAELAMALSTGPSGVDGGDLGWFRHGDMVAEFADATYGLEPGEVSGPVQSPFGWHVIKLEERRALDNPALADVEAELRDTMARDVIVEELDTLRANAEIEYTEPLPAAE